MSKKHRDITAEMVAGEAGKSAPFTAMYASLLDKEEEGDEGPDPRNPPVLRPSAFPLCAVSTLAGLLSNQYASSYLSTAFFGMGTAMHEAVHVWCSSLKGDTAVPFGNWSCCVSGKVVNKDSTDSKCPKCGGPCKYEELEVSWMGVKGHIDCVLVNKESGDVFIGDFKTTTDYQLREKSLTGWKTSYVHQLFAYAFMFKKHYAEILTGQGWKIKSVSILAISRNNPRNFREYSWTAKHALKHGENVLKREISSWMAAESALRNGDFERVWSKRRCKNAKHYLDEVADTFYDGCPMADKCVLAGGKEHAERFLSLMGLKAEK